MLQVLAMRTSYLFMLLLSVRTMIGRGVYGQSLFEMVTKKMVENENILGRRHSNEINYEKSEKYSESVSAGDIWDEDRMMKMLGIEEESYQQENLHRNIEEDAVLLEDDEDDFRDDQVPSLHSALYRKVNSPGSTIVPLKCRLPGMKGNVVRMLNNKGNILYQSQHQSIVELRFSLKHALHAYENITQAELQVTNPHDGNELSQEIRAWLVKNGLISAPQYKYEIYLTNDETWYKMKDKMLSMIKEEQNMESLEGRNDLLEERTSAMKSQITSILGQPIITKHHVSNVQEPQSRKIPIDVRGLVEKWKKVFFKSKRRAMCRAVLVVTMETSSFMTKQCASLIRDRPRLLLVSLDRRQCPLSVTSYIDNSAKYDNTNGILNENEDDNDVTMLKRRRRSTNNDIGRGKNRQKSNDENKKKYARVQTDKMKSARTPDLVQGASLHTGHSRAIRSTICRRYPMHVGFDDVGWGEWIIAPRGYHAYRCAGECPFPLGGRLNGTNHAILLTMMHSVDPWSSPTPCCVPTVLTPISLLYFDTSGNVVLRQYEDMVVNTCGCR